MVCIGVLSLCALAQSGRHRRVASYLLRLMPLEEGHASVPRCPLEPDVLCSSSASSVNSTLKDPPLGNLNASIGSDRPGAFKLVGAPQPRTTLKHHVSFSLTLGRAKICARSLKARMGVLSSAAAGRTTAVAAAAVMQLNPSGGASWSRGGVPVTSSASQSRDAAASIRELRHCC
jgi:hypothetical protein